MGMIEIERDSVQALSIAFFFLLNATAFRKLGLFLSSGGKKGGLI
jgi:hypothetical protein